MAFKKTTKTDEESTVAQPISGVGKDQVFAQRFEYSTDHPKWLRNHTPMWTWYRNGRITMTFNGVETTIDTRSFYDADTFAEIICDHSGPLAIEYQSKKVKYTRKMPDGAMKTAWAFKRDHDIADYARTGQRPRRPGEDSDWSTVSDDDMFPNAFQINDEDEESELAEAQALRDTAHIYPTARTMTTVRRKDRRIG